MIVVQRVRVRWSAAARGAPFADVRRGLAAPIVLPGLLPAGEVVVHEVLADEAAGYARTEEVLAGKECPAGLSLRGEGAAVSVLRSPGWEAYPRRPGRAARLFTLAPGEVGRYRANFRFIGCQCDPSWSYEEWVVHVGNGPGESDRFMGHGVDHQVDARVHLYGGRRR